MEKKLTKRDVYTGLITLIETGATDIDGATIIEFCKNEIELLDKKAAKAKERQAEKKAAGDELTAIVKAALTDEFQVTADIAAKVVETAGEDATLHKVSYRLSALVKAGEAESTDVKVPAVDGGKTRTIKGYRLLND